VFCGAQNFLSDGLKPNRPLPLVAQGTGCAKEKIVESGKNAAFQNIAPPCWEESLLGDLRGLSGAGGSILEASTGSESKFSSAKPKECNA
jgi:hypothetical protein